MALHLLNDAILLGRQDRNDEAIAIYNDLIYRFGSDTAADSLVAAALRNKGITLGELGRIDEAIAVYDDLIHFFGSHRFNSWHVALALRNKGVMLERLGHIDEAIAVYDDLINRFSGHTETPSRIPGLGPSRPSKEIWEHVAKARSYRDSLRKSCRPCENPVAADSGAALATIELRYGAHHRSRPIADTAPAGVA